MAKSIKKQKNDKVKSKSFGVLKSDTNKAGPKMEQGKKPYTKNGITYTWDRKNSVWIGDANKGLNTNKMKAVKKVKSAKKGASVDPPKKKDYSSKSDNTRTTNLDAERFKNLDKRYQSSQKLLMDDWMNKPKSSLNEKETKIQQEKRDRAKKLGGQGENHITNIKSSVKAVKKAKQEQLKKQKN